MHITSPPRAWLLTCVLASPACTTVVGSPGELPADHESADGAPLGDSSPAQTVDSGMAAPDATPIILYPEGPYGTNQGNVITNLGWMGYADTNIDADDDPFNESARMVKLEEFFEGNDPNATIIMIGSGAGWCGPCADEALELPGLYAQYHAGGARFITTMFETTSGAKATPNYAKSWGEQFNLPFATVADPDGLLDPYYTGNVIPMNMFIDAKTMKIISVEHGFSSSYTRQILASYAQ